MHSEESQRKNIPIKNDPVLEQEEHRVTEREPNKSVVEERSRQYAEQGITTKIAHDIVELIEEEHKGGNFFLEHNEDHFYTFYLNASDPLQLLEKHINIRGEHVLTVGSNGDFAKILIEKGAKQVDVFDISLPGVFYNELGMVALQELDFERYKECMNSWKFDEGNYGYSKNPSRGIFHPTLYHALREFLSEQAREYFDALINHPELFANEFFQFGQRREQELPSEGMILGYAATTHHYVTVIGDIVNNEDEYKKLQQKARETPVSFSWASANAMVKNITQANGTREEFVNDPFKSEKLFSPEYAEQFAQIDTVYLNNVEYMAEKQIVLAKRFLKAGVSRVMMTMRVDEYGWFLGQIKNKYIDEAGVVYEKDKYNREDLQWLEEHRFEIRRLVGYNEKPIFPGDILEYEGTPLHIIDYTDSVEFGMLVEMRKGE